MEGRDSTGRTISLLNDGDEARTSRPGPRLPSISHIYSHALLPAPRILDSSGFGSSIASIPSVSSPIPKPAWKSSPTLTPSEAMIQNLAPVIPRDSSPSVIRSHAATYSNQDPVKAGKDKAFRFIDVAVAPESNPEELAKSRKLAQKNAALFGHSVGGVVGTASASSAPPRDFMRPWSPNGKKQKERGKGTDVENVEGSEGMVGAGAKELVPNLQFVDVEPMAGAEERAAMKQLVRRNAAQYRWSQPQNTYRERKAGKPMRGVLKPRKSDANVGEQDHERIATPREILPLLPERKPEAMSVYSLHPGDSRVGRLLDSTSKMFSRTCSPKAQPGPNGTPPALSPAGNGDPYSSPYAEKGKSSSPTVKTPGSDTTMTG